NKSQNNRDQKTGRTAQATPEGVPCGGVSRQDQVATAEILDTIERWRKWAHEWSGSAFVSGEKLPKAGEGMSEDDHKSELYSGLCRLGSNLQWLHDELSAALASQPVPAVKGEKAWWIEEREDDALLVAPHWNFGKTCVARKPKLLTNDEWRPIAEQIIAGQAALSKSLASAQAVPEKVLVPRDATEAMIQEALKVDWSNEDEVGTAHNVWHGMLAAALAPATQAVTDIVRPVCRVMTMQHSSGAPDHYVSIEVGDRQITPHMFKTKGRAEYEVAEWIWLLNGGEKPSVLDFDTDPQPLPVSHKRTLLDETWNYRIPESLADLISLFENRVACHRMWAEWLGQDTDETRRYGEHGLGHAKNHWDYVKQYSAAKSLIEEHLRKHERAVADPQTVWVLPRTICDAFAEVMKPENADRYFSKHPQAVGLALTAALGAGSPGACRFCADTGWVDDQNWTWDYPDLPQERVPGNGKIRCGCGC
ncbi:MAG: hypothetical protein E5Y15_23185, partial [Mesorhizobium sp.]